MKYYHIIIDGVDGSTSYEKRQLVTDDKKYIREFINEYNHEGATLYLVIEDQISDDDEICRILEIK